MEIKKIGALLFLAFLEKNNYLYTSDWIPKIDTATLTAITLLIASSQDSEKEMLMRLIVHFLVQNTNNEKK